MGNMNKAILLHANINKSTEVGYIGNDARQLHTRFQIFHRTNHPSAKRNSSIGARGSRPGFSNSFKISSIVNWPIVSVTKSFAFNLFSHLRFLNQVLYSAVHVFAAIASTT